MGRRGNKRYYIPAAIWAIVILSVTSIPYLTPPSLGFTWQDKLEHFGAYSIFGVAVAYGNIRSGKKNALLIAVIFCSIFGMLDEIHQYWIPGRSMDPYDWVADTLGALIGAAVLIASKKIWLPWFASHTQSSK